MLGHHGELSRQLSVGMLVAFFDARFTCETTDMIVGAQAAVQPGPGHLCTARLGALARATCGRCTRPERARDGDCRFPSAPLCPFCNVNVPYIHTQRGAS